MNIPIKRKKTIIRYLNYCINGTFLSSINTKDLLKDFYKEYLYKNSTKIIFTMPVDDAPIYAFQELSIYDPLDPDKYDNDHNLIVNIARRILIEEGE